MIAARPVAPSRVVGRRRIRISQRVADRRQRVAQLVRQHGQELVLAAVRLAQRLADVLLLFETQVVFAQLSLGALTFGDALFQLGVRALDGEQRAPPPAPFDEERADERELRKQTPPPASRYPP